MALLESSDGDLWVGTMGGGLNRFDPATLKAEVFQNDPAVPTTLGASGVMSLLEVDKQLWVGTFGGGISRFDARTRRFDNLRARSRRRPAPVERPRDRAGARPHRARVDRHRRRRPQRLGHPDAPALLLQARRQAARLAERRHYLLDPGGRRRRRLDRHARRRHRSRAESRRRAGAAALRQHLRGAGPAQQHRLRPARRRHRRHLGEHQLRPGAPRSEDRRTSSASTDCTACRPRNSTSARTTAIAAASCSSAAPPGSIPSTRKCSSSTSARRAWC